MTLHHLSIYKITAAALFCFGILCFIYFGFVSIYTKNLFSFALIWLFGGIGSLIFSFALFYIEKNKIRVPHWLILLFLLLLVLATSIFGICEFLIVNRMFAYPQKQVDYLIVLGAGLKKDKITKSLEFRLNAAYDYLSDHEDVIAIVSGGMGSGETITEAQAMASYLEEKGISKDRIKLEKKSTNTYENILYSKKFLPHSDTRIAIVTNNFHLYRAEQIAKKQNLNHVEGLAASSDLFLIVHFMVREGFAVLKYRLTGMS